MNTVYFDLETSGLHCRQHEVIQIAALAVNSDRNTVGEFERKLTFDITKADPEALKKNHYDEEVWKREAIPPGHAWREFANFIRTHADIERKKKSGNGTYRVCLLSGYNVVAFDCAWLEDAKQLYCGGWLSHDMRVRDVFRFALSALDALGVRDLPDYKLKTVCERLLLDGDLGGLQFHDALDDVRATVMLDTALLHTFAAGFALV